MPRTAKAKFGGIALIWEQLLELRGVGDLDQLRAVGDVGLLDLTEVGLEFIYQPHTLLLLLQLPVVLVAPARDVVGSVRLARHVRQSSRLELLKQSHDREL